MNLNNLNLVELNAQEIKEVDGGAFVVDDVVIALTVGFVLLAVDNWSDIKKGASDAWFGR
jgi:hypothetical protein